MLRIYHKSYVYQPHKWTHYSTTNKYDQIKSPLRHLMAFIFNISNSSPPFKFSNNCVFFPIQLYMKASAQNCIIIAGGDFTKLNIEYRNYIRRHHWWRQQIFHTFSESNFTMWSTSMQNSTWVRIFCEKMSHISWYTLYLYLRQIFCSWLLHQCKHMFSFINMY